jgi:solute carrier family 25 (mitochondrial carnitine/acylcarnitine transporter), member 20/29
MDFTQFLNGAISGMFGISISHPIDTIKTSIQDNKNIKYNMRFLYRGVLPALSGVGMEKAIVFGTYVNTKHYLEEKNFNKKYINFLSGLASGTSAAFIVTPVERLKILSQTGHKITIKDIHPFSLYRGISATFTREIPGFAIYFSTYNYLKNKYYQDNIPLQMSFVFGGLSGAISWFGIYPQDIIKTRMQAHNISNNTFIGTATDIYKNGGIPAFFKGFRFALLRAIPLHAGTFMMMELLNNKKSF